MNLEDKISWLIEHDHLCDICKYQIECSGPGTKQSPDGWCYQPKCADGDDVVTDDEELIEQEFDNWTC